MKMSDLTNKGFIYKFEAKQVKQILVDFLILAGEDIPKEVDSTTYVQDDNVKIISETNDGVSDDFEINISFSQEDLDTYHSDLKDAQESAGPEADVVPDNVWTAGAGIVSEADCLPADCAGCKLNVDKEPDADKDVDQDAN